MIVFLFWPLNSTRSWMRKWPLRTELRDTEGSFVENSQYSEISRALSSSAKLTHNIRVQSERQVWDWKMSGKWAHLSSQWQRPSTHCLLLPSCVVLSRGWAGRRGRAEGRKEVMRSATTATTKNKFLWINQIRRVWYLHKETLIFIYEVYFSKFI